MTTRYNNNNFYIETSSSSRYDNFVCSNYILFITKANALNCHGKRLLGFQKKRVKIVAVVGGDGCEGDGGDVVSTPSKKRPRSSREAAGEEKGGERFRIARTKKHEVSLRE
uniref:Uncharacterized protein n=1 Tax=Vespula pensylvanica TaxID=30213 RepID=A0A834UDF8_VESPE|nr:hypothetical protein H0235_004926 [Vespula pensylvanica]